MHIALLQP